MNLKAPEVMCHLLQAILISIRLFEVDLYNPDKSGII